MANPIRVVFFDAGGTLIRTAAPVGHYYALVASHYGLHADEEALQKGFKRAWLEMKPRDPVQGARVMDDQAWWKGLVRRSWQGQGMPADFPFEDYFQEVYALFARPELWRIYPDALLALDMLHVKGLRCGVLSNWDRRLRAILEGLDLSRHFEHLVISSEVGVEKPHPLIFQRAQELFGIQASEALLLGDDDLFDGEGGRRAGWRLGLLQRPETDLMDVLENCDIM